MPKHARVIQTNLQPTSRELRWFAHIDRHGPQSSEFLFELTRDTHRCKDTALRRMQALREAGYLFLPPQQRLIAKADFHPYVYDLTPTGIEYLSYYLNLEYDTRPTGHWWHGFWVSSVSSAIEIVAVRSGLEYVPANRILAIKGVTSQIPLNKGCVIPDQLFAIRYPEGYRTFALEMDRGTEPVQSPAARKSLRRSVQQYSEILDQKLHQQHFGLRSNLIVLWAFLSKARERQFSTLAGSSGNFQSGIVSSEFPAFQSVSSYACEICDIELHSTKDQ